MDKGQDIVFLKQISSDLLTPKGCEYYAIIKSGKFMQMVKTTSSLGCNIFEWKDLEFSVHQKQAEIQSMGNC